MRLATIDDKHKVIEIITETFSNNPGVNWLLKPGGNRQKKVKMLAESVFHKAFILNGIFISDNEKGIAICYQFNKQRFSFKVLYYELRFILFAAGLSRLPNILKREAYRKSIRPANGNYLYFWFLGVMKGGEKAVYEIRDAIFELARREKLQIYIETAMYRNKVAYERFGFSTYHHWNNKEKNIEFWFMKWEPEIAP